MTAVEPPGLVTMASPTRDKLALFADRFRARADVYAGRWDNARTGAAGWMPAVAGAPRALSSGLHRTRGGSWVKKAETDAGQRPGTTSSDAERLAALERKVRELRRANQILKSAASFFAAELDRPSR
ncbi:TOTE conflict system archaeo-eukaryotic primase domain-containing protein [Micromonospora sp. LOL_024]|uniref:TOTE conflict system archaeo-eukaryotic primase domain-containing protein n=1 Tax=Micromonospora sp. LOL_024 TaxID=3345412 RepID=UPI003A88EFFA